MRLERLGALHPTRISFARTLVRRMAREKWSICLESNALDPSGNGEVVYRISTPHRTLWFVAFAAHLDADDRTDRVIAEKWDATFTLTTAAPTGATLARLRHNVTLQEQGRCSPSELVLSRANKSVRLFDHVADCLACGRQPLPERIASIGYLVRTTAVYGNGKFGLADFAQLLADGIFRLPFQAEMLCVFLARQFSLHWVEHIANRRNPEESVPLAPALKRALGVGNATGLGMAPFLVGHPKLLCRWIRARETALARVRNVRSVDRDSIRRFHDFHDRAIRHVGQWSTSDERQTRRNTRLLADLMRLRDWPLADAYPWDHLFRRSEANCSLEAQELINSLLIELYPGLVDDLEQSTASDECMTFDPAMNLSALRRLIESRYDWALAMDFSSADAQALFWYRSVEKEEPRLGQRHKEPGAKHEMRIAVARDVAALHARITAQASDAGNLTVAAFVMAEPEWRETVRRIQALSHCPFAEIHANLIDRTCRPVDLLRCKLSIFGATRFDPKSDLWTRITLFQGAPLPEQLQSADADDWCFPALGEVGDG